MKACLLKRQQEYKVLSLTAIMFYGATVDLQERHCGAITHPEKDNKAGEVTGAQVMRSS